MKSEKTPRKMKKRFKKLMAWFDEKGKEYRKTSEEKESAKNINEHKFRQ